MDIRLNARLSAYGKFPPADCGCSVDTVTKEEIDSLFGGTLPPVTPKPQIVNCTTAEVTYADIDSLFNKE